MKQNLTPEDVDVVGPVVKLRLANKDLEERWSLPADFPGLNIDPRDLRDVNVVIDGVKYHGYPEPIEDFEEEADKITRILVFDNDGNIELHWTE